MIKKYDLFFSLGEACATSDGLRRLKLQKASYPFDWLAGNNFLGRTNILCSEFKDFMNFNDLVYHSYRAHDGAKDIYINSLNKLVFNHDFELGGVLAQTYPEVKEKYNRRIRRLLDKIEKANKVLIIYMILGSSSEKISDEKILQAKEILHKKFGNKIELLILKSDLSIDKNTIINHQLDSNVTVIRLNNSNTNPSGYNNKVFKKVFKNYRLRMSIKDRIKDIKNSTLALKKSENTLLLHFLPYFKNRIFRLKISISKKQLDICIGSSKPIP